MVKLLHPCVCTKKNVPNIKDTTDIVDIVNVMSMMSAMSVYLCNVHRFTHMSGMFSNILKYL